MTMLAARIKAMSCRVAVFGRNSISWAPCRNLKPWEVFWLRTSHSRRMAMGGV